MKKEIKALIGIVLAVWFFVMGFEIGIYKERKANEQANSNLPVVDISSTAPQSNYVAPPADTTAPSVPADTTAPSVNNDATEPSNNTEPTKDNSNDPSKMSKADILKNASAAVNNLKNEKNFKAHKKMAVDVKVVDCSIPRMVSTINDIISGVTKDANYERDMVFQNGVWTDESGNAHTATDEVPPEGGFTVPVEGVASAKAEKKGNNIVYTLVIAKEDTTLEQPKAPYHSASSGFLDLGSLDIPIIKITKADMHYPGSTIVITVNEQGKLVELDNHLPMTGEGAASLFGATGTATFEGALDEHWVITY